MLSLITKRIFFVASIAIAAIGLDYYFNSLQVWYTRDILLGGMIGFALAMLVFPRRAALDFRQSIIPVLRAYSEYLNAITKLFLREKDENDVQDKKNQVEKCLTSPLFPEWVYKIGFSSFFREGHRHFLIRVEQLGQVLFAMNHVARQSIDPDLLDTFRLPIERCVSQTEKLMAILLARLSLKEPEDTLPDLIEDITVLENVFHEVVNLPLELLDMSEDFIHIAAFIYDLKDLRKILLRLAEALR